MKSVLTLKGPLWPRFGAAAGVSLLLLMSLHSHGLAAQELLVEFTDARQPQLAAPSHSVATQAVRVYGQRLAGVASASNYQVQIGEAEYATVRVQEVVSYVNGDLGISARGQGEHSDLSFTLTLGTSSVFGYISAERGLWQIYATGGDPEYLGWVYQPGGLTNNQNGLNNDFFIPDRTSPTPRPINQQLKIRPYLPLQLAGTAITPAVDSASAADIAPHNFSVNQTFHPDPVIIGEVTEAQVTLSNSSNETHTGLALDVFFILEDSTLVSADSNCVEQLSASQQEVLHCELGDFRPGEEKILSFAVQTKADSPSQLLSTVVIGTLRDDKFINVVQDVRTDSDRDGVSDFNEELAGTDPFDAGSVDLTTSVIDVLALYTDGATAEYPLGVETRINQLMSVANQIYRDSGVAIKLRPVQHQRVEYNDVDDMDTALNHLIDQSHSAFSDVNQLRESYGADLVVLFRALEASGGRCGLAPVGGFRTDGFFDSAVESPFAYSHVAIDCPLDIAVAHELGHNMGLTHSHIEDGYGGTFNFSTGYGVDSQFVTVMAYPEAFNTETRVPQFSNPRAECLGFACGVDADDESGADAVQSLNLVRQQIANYYPTVVPDLPATSVSALSGDTNAVISIAASRDSGRSFSSSFSPQDRVDMSVTIQVDDRHIGSQGSLHVLVGEKDDSVFYQLNGEGRLVLWDGVVDSLIPIGDERTLYAEERLSLLNGFQFGHDLVGLNLVVYVGYRVPETDDFVYTDAPLALSIVRSR